METRNQLDKVSEGQVLLPLVENRFQFACHPNLPCFTECCRNLRLVLTPYDIIRLKQRLQLSSSEFLDKYTLTDWDEELALPIVLLNMNDSKYRQCPFVSSTGCLVYSDRPMACRIFPLAQATKMGFYKIGDELTRCYFLVKEPYCQGVKESRVWCVSEWLKDQEVGEYSEQNKDWMELIIRYWHHLTQTNKEKKFKMFYLASYNLDQFREFIFHSRFLKLFQVDDMTLTKIKESDIELMKFAVQWLKFSLFGESVLKLKDDVPGEKTRSGSA